MLVRRGILIDVFVVLFVVSIPWNWLLLYREKVAENRAEMSKLSRVPEHCKSEEETAGTRAFVQWIGRKITFQEDRCRIYHKTHIVDPILSASPIEAFARTLSSLTIAPARAVGKAMSEFNLNFIGRIPFTIWIPALITWLSLVIATVFCAYASIRTRGFAHPSPQPIVVLDRGSSVERRRRWTSRRPRAIAAK